MSYDGRGKLKIMLVEDDPGDQELARRALQPFGHESDLIIVSDGQEALDHLNRTCPHHSLPDMVFLDLNMPKISGVEVLQTLRKNPRTRPLPVIVLTTSSNEDDVTKCYRLGCSSFVTKPIDALQYFKKIQGIATYWLEVATVPVEHEFAIPLSI